MEGHSYQGQSSFKKNDKAPCRFHQVGNCLKGNACAFYHGLNDKSAPFIPTDHKSVKTQKKALRLPNTEFSHYDPHKKIEPEGDTTMDIEPDSTKQIYSRLFDTLLGKDCEYSSDKISIRKAKQAFLTLDYHEKNLFTREIQSLIDKFQPFECRTILLNMLKQRELSFEFKDMVIECVASTLRKNESFPNESLIERAKDFLYKDLGSIPYDSLINFITIFRLDTKISMEDLINRLVDLRKKECIKVAKAIVDHFKVNIKNIPGLKYQMEMNHIYYLLNKYPWYRVEEMLIVDKDMLSRYATVLFSKKSIQDSLSIIKRNELEKHINKKEICDHMKQFGASIKKNPILESNEFGPIEEALNPQEKGNYVNFKDFALNEQNIIIVEDVDQYLFNVYTNDILNSTIVGLDSEWQPAITPYDNRPVSIYQIGTEKNVYIFDLLKMSAMAKPFFDFMRELLANRKIKKIGQCISEDIKNYLDKDFPFSEIKNVYDLQKIFQIFYPNEKSNLAYITEKILKKKLSKGEQVSSWSRRPLRKSQIHYAAMDAFICIKLFEKLEYMSLIQKNKSIDELLSSAEVEKSERKKLKYDKNNKENDYVPKSTGDIHH